MRLKDAADHMARVAAAQRKIERSLACLGEPAAWWRYCVRDDPQFLVLLARFLDEVVRRHSAAEMARALAANDVSNL